MPEPRVLLFDLENTPITGYAWGVGKYDRVIRVQDPWYILCVGYRWLGEDTTHCFGIDDTDVKEWNDDRGVVAKIHELFTEADVLIAHNGDRFDIPKARARMIIHGMKPPRPCLSVDTLKMARKEFEFTSNSLDAVCQVLGLGRKSPTGGFDLWLRCMAGDEEAWRTMKAYCQSDVELLEKLYLRLRPWAARHPNLALIGDNLPSARSAARTRASNLAAGATPPFPNAPSGSVRRVGGGHMAGRSSSPTLKELSDDSLAKWRQAVIQLLEREPDLKTHKAQTQPRMLAWLDKEISRRKDELQACL